jgi:hypothetical protein
MEKEWMGNEVQGNTGFRFRFRETYRPADHGFAQEK